MNKNVQQIQDSVDIVSVADSNQGAGKAEQRSQRSQANRIKA